MKLSTQTTELLDKLDSVAARKLSHRNELGVLIELARQQQKMQQLDELSFFAKVAHGTSGIVKRIGNDAEGYDKLSKEFGESVEKSKNLIDALLTTASDETKKKFSSDFLTMSPTAFQNLLALLHDLSWYKNHLIDTRKS